MNTGKVFLGILAGAATGALMGVLFAPDKGKNTREKISKKSTDTVEGFKSAFEELLTNLSERLKAAQAEANHIYAEGKNGTKAVKKEAKDMLS